MHIKRIRKTYKNMKMIREMDLICFPDDSPMLFGLRKYYCWIVYENEQAIAYAIGGKMQNFYFLARAGVLPEWRGRNIQQLLIQERIKKAMTLDNIDGIITYTSIENISSIKNLIDCGFSLWENPSKSFKKKGFTHWKLDIETARCLYGF